MSIFGSKPQRYKAVIKDGKPTGQVRQTNTKRVTHKALDAIKPHPSEKPRKR